MLLADGLIFITVPSIKLETGILPNVDKHPPFRELMKHKHKAYTVTDEDECETMTDPLISWIVHNIDNAHEVMTFMAIPVRLQIENYLAYGQDPQC